MADMQVMTLGEWVRKGTPGSFTIHRTKHGYEQDVLIVPKEHGCFTVTVLSEEAPPLGIVSQRTYYSIAATRLKMTHTGTMKAMGLVTGSKLLEMARKLVENDRQATRNTLN